MTNTRITDPEILERNYPVILKSFYIREGSGGAGKYKGGNGVVRTIEFREKLSVSILSERRAFSPYGLEGGCSGKKGLNLWARNNSEIINLGGKNTFVTEEGDIVEINTPGGGGFGMPQN